jgi:hypothetical protein
LFVLLLTAAVYPFSTQMRGAKAREQKAYADRDLSLAKSAAMRPPIAKSNAVNSPVNETAERISLESRYAAGRVALPFMRALNMAPTGTTWYVSPVPLGSGTLCVQALPCATFNQAMANAAASGDTIEVAAGTFHEHDLIIDKSLTIHGAGANATIVDAQQLGRIFLINAGVTVSISNLTITGGKALDGVVSPGPFGTTVGQRGHDGGAILNRGTLSLFQCSITNNRAGNGPPATTGGPGGLGGGVSNEGSRTSPLLTSKPAVWRFCWVPARAISALPQTLAWGRMQGSLPNH